MIVQGRLLSDPRETPVPGWTRIDEGRIAEIGHGDPPQRPQAGGPEAIITPGFIDAHLHLPQVDSVGCDGRHLLEWLDDVIYPAEERWGDKATAEAECAEAYRRIAAAGTLGYAGYLTSHRNGVHAVIRAAQGMPLRAIAGQVLMDRGAPESLLGQRRTRLARSQRGRLELSANPRFAVTCSETMLREVGRMKAEGAWVQTHLAESPEECELVRKLFPEAPHYTGIYESFGLLGPRTLLAHGVHLDDDEWRLIAERRCVIVHCPQANIFLRAGLFDLDAARRHDVRLALGSDVAAGCDLAMPRVARAMIETAKVRSCVLDRPVHVPDAAEAWSLITRGNAEALGFDDAGRLEAGYVADLLVLTVPFEPDDRLVSRIIHTWRDDYITQRIVDGRLLPLH
jgi:guanine deaminase